MVVHTNCLDEFPLYRSHKKSTRYASPHVLAYYYKNTIVYYYMVEVAGTQIWQNY